MHAIKDNHSRINVEPSLFSFDLVSTNEKVDVENS